MTFDPATIAPPGARIKVIGVGGGGGNAVNTMIRSGLDGVDFITANTDIQALRFSLSPNKVQVGKELTRGLGAGADPDVGRDAALEDRHEIQEYIQGADMVFITAGMGGGTGTGGASVVAQIARELGALTVAVVTKPFGFEGKRRRKHADVGIARLRECVDTLITIPNQRLLQVAHPGLSMIDAFKMADEVLVNAVKGISDIINIPGIVNVDFADVKTVMSCMGQALMGIGRASGESRAVEAARQAICSPLLEDIDIEGATGILVNITASSTVTLMEINEACSIIQEAAHEDANFIFGSVVDESLGDEIRVTVIATGFPVDGHVEESPDAVKAQASVLPPFGGTRLTTSPLTTGKVATRTTTPQHYSPLTKKVEPSRVRFDVPVAPAPLQQQVAAPAFATPARQEPGVDFHHTSAIAETPSVQHAAPSAPAFVSREVQQRASEEAAELTRWTLAADEEQAPAAEEAGELHDAHEFGFAQAEAALAPTQQADSRIEGARFIDDPTDEFSLAADEPHQPSVFDQARRRDEAFGDGFGDESFTLFGSEPAQAPRDLVGATLGAEEAPLESFFETEGAFIGGDIDRKIDEALELAERMKNPRSAQGGDELDVPAFLRNGMKDLPL